MQGLYSQISYDSFYLAGTSALLVGLAGSLHCVGMCSPIVFNVAKSPAQNFRYQWGRLTGYLFLGATSGLLINLININGNNKALNLIMAILIGMTLLILGIFRLTYFKSKSFHLDIPFVHKVYKKLFQFSQKHEKLGPFLIGLATIFLPCGFLYSIVLAAGATSSPSMGAISLFFFWLGTLPAMSFGLEVIRKLFRPLKEKRPNTSAIFLMALGVLTISFRLFQFYNPENLQCH